MEIYTKQRGAKIVCVFKYIYYTLPIPPSQTVRNIYHFPGGGHLGGAFS